MLSLIVEQWKTSLIQEPFHGFDSLPQPWKSPELFIISMELTIKLVVFYENVNLRFKSVIKNK